MKVLGMGMPELIIILCVVLLIFGPKNLPKLGSAIGKTVKGLREGMSGNSDEEEVEEEEAPKKSKSSKGAIAAAEEEDEEVIEVEEEEEEDIDEAAPASTKVKKTVKVKTTKE